MRILTVCFLVFFALALMVPVTPAHALSVGGPVRTLDDGGISLTGSIGYAKLDLDDDEVTSKSFFFKGAFYGSDRLMPYFKLGFADLEIGSFEGSLDFAYGGGVLLDLIGQDRGSGFRTSLDAQIMWAESSDGGTNLDLMESQLSLVMSTRTGGTSAYAGLATSFLDLDGGGYNLDENGQGHMYFGVDYYMDYNFYFNAEAHLFGQDMLTIGVGYQF